MGVVRAVEAIGPEPEQSQSHGRWGYRIARRAGRGGGTRREPIHGGLAKTSMFSTVPPPHPARPARRWLVRKGDHEQQPVRSSVWVMRYRGRSVDRRSFGNSPTGAGAIRHAVEPGHTWLLLLSAADHVSGRPAGSPRRDARKHGCFLAAPMDGFTACPGAGLPGGRPTTEKQKRCSWRTQTKTGTLSGARFQNPSLAAGIRPFRLPPPP